MRLGQLPRGFAGLLLNQVAVHDLEAEAILHSSRDLALQALLADPVVDRDGLSGNSQLFGARLRRGRAVGVFRAGGGGFY